MDEPKRDDLVDKIIVRGLAIIQLLMCLAGLAILPFAFMYGGAAVWPSRFQNSIFFLLFGLGTALYLFSRQALARMLALLWYGTLIGTMVFRLRPQQIGASGAATFVLLWSALALLYLVVTSVGPLWTETKGNPAAAAYVLLSVSAFALVVAGFAFLTRESVDGLERQLHSSDGNARCVAAHRLGTKGAEARIALPALKAMLDNTLCVDVGEFADDPAKDIEKIGGIDPLIEVMKSGAPLGRSAAAWHLRGVAAKYPDRADDLKAAFAAGLKDDNGLVRQASIEGIGVLGSRAADLLPELTKLINDPEQQVRDSVVDASGNAGSLDNLCVLLVNPDKQVRLQTIQKLEFGTFGDSAIPLLESALSDTYEWNSREAARALERFGRRALPAFNSLERAALSSPDPDTRVIANHALKEIGAEGLPIIVKGLQDRDENVRNDAIALVGSYGRAGAPALAAFLGEPWTPSTKRAVEILENAGPEALPARNALDLTAHASPDQSTRILAIAALGKIGPQGYASITNLLDDPDPAVSAQAWSWKKSLEARYPHLRNAE
jgi:HEAT repeat protein